MAEAESESKSVRQENKLRGDRLQMQGVWLSSVPILLSIHIWSILHVFEEVPAWINKLTIWELIGAIAYTQVFALLESVIFLTLFLAARLILPRKWFADQFVPATSLLVVVITLWAIAAHNYDKVIRNWGGRDFLPWLLLIVVSLIIPLLVSRLERARNITTAIVERASILAFVYLFIDSLSIIIIVARNL